MSKVTTQTTTTISFTQKEIENLIRVAAANEATELGLKGPPVITFRYEYGGDDAEEAIGVSAEVTYVKTAKS